jgi:hypothetical protein
MSSQPFPQSSLAMVPHSFDESPAILPPSDHSFRIEYQDYDDVMADDGTEHDEDESRSVLSDRDEGSSYAEPPLSVCATTDYQASEFDAEETYPEDASEDERDDGEWRETKLHYVSSQGSASNWESTR